MADVQFKWLEDFVALAATGSFSRAAELRHVTHPAFGRRIRALEDWAGSPLVERGSVPVVLTGAGESLLAHAQQTVQALELARGEIQSAAGRSERTLTLATGRTLARTLVADWLLRLKTRLAGTEVHIRTGSLAETLQMLERGEADFMLAYHHPLLAVRLNARQYTTLTLAQDRLVAVSRAGAQGKPQHPLGRRHATPYLAYAGTLALGRLVQDHLANHPQAPRLSRVVESDSADALLEYTLKGLGVAWLPWSLAAGACKAGQLVTVGDAALDVAFEVRMVRPKRRLSALAEDLWQATLPR